MAWGLYTLWRCNVAKLYVTKITVFPLQGGMQEVVKAVDGDPYIETVTDKTVMSMTAIKTHLLSRGWYYAGHKGGGYVYMPKQYGATRLTVEV
jgi:hypothetical protein